MHQPGRSTRGLQSMPLVADGMLYYSGSYSQVFALDGATGEVIWSYFPKLDEDLVAAADALALQSRHRAGPRQRLRRHGRRPADRARHEDRQAGLGHQADRFQEAHGRLHRRAAVRQGQGHHRRAGRRMALAAARSSASTPTPARRYGSSSRSAAPRRPRRPGATTPGAPAAAAAGCPAPTTRRPTPSGGAPATRLRSTTGPARNGRPRAPRPGDNLYTTSVIGARSRHRQAQVLSPGAAARRLGLRQRGRRVRDARARRPEYHRAPEQGRLRLRLRPQQRKVENVWRLVQNINFVKDIDPKTGELIGRRDMAEGRTRTCARASPAASAGTAGTYNPQTGLYYKVGNEWCMDLDVVKTTPILEPMAQLNIGANFKLTNPRRRQGARPRRRARPDHRREEVGGEFPRAAAGEPAVHRPATWCSCRMRAACCAPTTPPPARSCGRTTTASATTAASSATRAGGKQYVAVMTGWGSLVGDEYAALFGGPYTSMAEGLRRARRLRAAVEPGTGTRAVGPALVLPHLSDSINRMNQFGYLSISGLALARRSPLPSMRKRPRTAKEARPPRRHLRPRRSSQSRRSIRTSAACSRRHAVGAIRAAAGLPAAVPSSPAPTRATSSSSARSSKASRPACRRSARASTMTRSEQSSPTSGPYPRRRRPRRHGPVAGLAAFCSPSPPSARSRRRRRDHSARSRRAA